VFVLVYLNKYYVNTGELIDILGEK